MREAGLAWRVVVAVARPSTILITPASDLPPQPTLSSPLSGRLRRSRARVIDGFHCRSPALDHLDVVERTHEADDSAAQDTHTGDGERLRVEGQGAWTNKGGKVGWNADVWPTHMRPTRTATIALPPPPSEAAGEEGAVHVFEQAFEKPC